MPVQSAPILLPLLLVAALLTGLALIAAWRRQTPAVIIFSILMGALAIWTLSYAMEFVRPTADAKPFLGRMQDLGIVLAPATWLLLAMEVESVSVTALQQD